MLTSVRDAVLLTLNVKAPITDWFFNLCPIEFYFQNELFMCFYVFFTSKIDSSNLFSYISIGKKGRFIEFDPLKWKF